MKDLKVKRLEPSFSLSDRDFEKPGEGDGDFLKNFTIGADF